MKAGGTADARIQAGQWSAECRQNTSTLFLYLNAAAQKCMGAECWVEAKRCRRLELSDNLVMIIQSKLD